MKRLLIVLVVGISVMGCESPTVKDQQVQHLQNYASDIKDGMNLLNQDTAQLAFDMRLFNQRWEQFLKSLSDEQLTAIGNYEEVLAVGTIIDRAIARRALINSFDQEQISQINQFHNESGRLKDQMHQIDLQARKLTQDRYELVEYSQQMLAKQQWWADQYQQTETSIP